MSSKHKMQVQKLTSLPARHVRRTSTTTLVSTALLLRRLFADTRASLPGRPTRANSKIVPWRPALHSSLPSIAARPGCVSTALFAAHTTFHLTTTVVVADHPVVHGRHPRCSRRHLLTIWTLRLRPIGSTAGLRFIGGRARFSPSGAAR